jgi:hypothetical protein
MSRVPALLLPALLVGCSPSAISPAQRREIVTDPAPSATAPALAVEPRTALGVAAIVGAWEGPSCEGRNYVRRVTFEGDGTFMAIDLVAPCPAGAACVWSGMILWKGTWQLRDSRVVLDVDRSTRLPDAVPQWLTVGQNARELAETPGTSCRYVPVH